MICDTMNDKKFYSSLLDVLLCFILFAALLGYKYTKCNLSDKVIKTSHKVPDGLIFSFCSGLKKMMLSASVCIVF